jgi:hypothetical protein
MLRAGAVKWGDLIMQWLVRMACGISLGLAMSATTQPAAAQTTPAQSAAEGSGPYPAMQLAEPGLPDHVVYRPRDLSRLDGKKLPILLWGNGGCSDDGTSARLHLSEIASHAYLVIAPGKIRSGPGAEAAPPAPPPPAPGGGLPWIKTTTEQVMAGLDWALAENRRQGSPYYGKLDPAAVAVAGHSCGGLQAIVAGADPRVRTVIVQNSGIFADGTNPIPGLTVDKSMLRKLHTPILYVLGGPSDIAWPNGTDDFAKIDYLPAVLVSADVGHGGTFGQPNGGGVATIVTDWLAWQLRGDHRAGRMFRGPDCSLCDAPGWKIEQKNLR